MRTLATVLLASTLVAGCTAAGGPSAAPTPAPVTPVPDATTPAPATFAPTDAAMLVPATVTFDGTTCTYLGPTVVPLRSVIEWTFETTATTAEERANWELLVWDVRAEATWEMIVAWAAENTLVQEPPWRWPPWSTDGQGMTVEEWAAKGPLRTPVEKNLTLVSCGVKPRVLADGQTVHPAELIRAIKG